MKILLALLLCMMASASIAQTLRPADQREEDEEYRNEREAWITAMHRSEAGLNYKAIDEVTRQAKADRFYESYHSKFNSIQSVIRDTFADGKLLGTWAERGSNNVCGRTHTADIDFSTKKIYVASSMGNIWKATLGDSDWTVLNDAQRFGNIRMIRLMNIPTAKRLIVACNETVAIRYSDDDGESWKQATGLDAPKSWGSIRRAAIASDNTIYLVGNEWDYPNGRSVSFLYRSVDYGKKFTKVGSWNISSDLCDIWVPRNTSSLAYFIKGDSLFTIGPVGKLSFISSEATEADAILLDGRSDGVTTILARCVKLNNESAVSKSSGNFKEWEAVGAVSGSVFSANSFRISQAGPEQYYFGTNDLNIWSEVQGVFSIPHSWGEYYSDPLHYIHADIDGVDILLDPNGKEIMLVSTDGGTYLSDDQMESVDNITASGIRTSQYYSTYTSAPPYTINAGSQDQGFQRGDELHPGILDMQQIISGDYGHLTSSDSGNSIWGDYPGFAIYYPNARSSSQYRSWNFTGSNKLWMPPVVATPGKPNSALIANGSSSGDASHLWKLTATGNTIFQSELPYDFSMGNADRRVSAMAYSPFDVKEVYALSNDGYFYHSTDGAMAWTPSDNNSVVTSHYFYGSVILPSKLSHNSVWIAGSGYSNPGVFQSIDNGKSFIARDSGLPHTMIYGLAASDDERYIFAATEVGPYCYSVPAGRWFDLQSANSTTAPDMVYWSVEKIPQSNTIRFGSYGRGIWDFNYDTIGGATGTVRSSETASILNFRAIPSITSGTTRFEFTVAEATDAAITIYDIEGRIVANFSNHVAAGEATYNWIASSGLSTGFYTAILRIGTSVAFTKVELVK